MNRTLRNNSLSVVTLGLFAVFLFFMRLTGQREYNQDQVDHGSPRSATRST